jgi:hypothetical protein
MSEVNLQSELVDSVSEAEHRDYSHPFTDVKQAHTNQIMNSGKQRTIIGDDD